MIMIKKYLTVTTLVVMGAICSFNQNVNASASETACRLGECRQVIDTQDQVRNLIGELVSELKNAGLTEQEMFELVLTVNSMRKQGLEDRAIINLLKRAVNKKIAKKGHKKLYIGLAVTAAVIVAFVTVELVRHRAGITAYVKMEKRPNPATAFGKALYADLLGLLAHALTDLRSVLAIQPKLTAPNTGTEGGTGNDTEQYRE